MAKNRIASMESARTSAPTPAPQTLAMVEPSGSKDDAVKENVATADTERALNLGAAGEKEVQQRLGALDLYTGPRTGALDAGDPVCARGMAEEEWLRADIIPQFRATCGATSGQRDRVSEVPRRSACEPAGRYRGSPPCFGQTFAKGAGDASGETASARRRPLGVWSSERTQVGKRPRPRLRLRLPSFSAGALHGGTERDCRNCRRTPV